MYSEAISYLESVGKDEDVLIVHHWDMDGSASAAIISEVLEETRGRPADTIVVPKGRKHNVGKRAENVVENKEVERLIVLDMNVPSDRVEELAGLGSEILIIDHHNFDEVPEDAVFVNPRREDEEAYVPAAKLCNDIASRFDLELDWIAGLGVIQDFAVEGHEELFEQLKEDYPRYFPENITQEEMAKNCRYGEYSSIMNIKPYNQTDRCARLAHDALLKSDGLKELEMQDEYGKLEEYYRQMQTEVERATERFNEEKQVFEEEKLVFFEFDSDFHINSSIATSISLDDHDWIYLVANTHGGEANVSARCQSGRVDLGSLLQEALPEDTKGEAGGHKRAAGASLPVERLDEFLDNLRGKL
ncbi:MAG: DHHA1 domain-containing protein [Candidatus Nanohaloarchaeota archaeon QJJ-7]|nr:DHHA1 domain-containing protein [Candidatus Nanohaloarchaeota archaeon QJJ-7]